MITHFSWKAVVPYSWRETGPIRYTCPSTPAGAIASKPVTPTRAAIHDDGNMVLLLVLQLAALLLLPPAVGCGDYLVLMLMLLLRERSRRAGYNSTAYDCYSISVCTTSRTGIQGIVLSRCCRWWWWWWRRWYVEQNEKAGGRSCGSVGGGALLYLSSLCARCCCVRCVFGHGRPLISS